MNTPYTMGELCNRLADALEQRDWLIAQCGLIGVTVNVVLCAPITQAYRLVNTELEHERADRAADVEELQSERNELQGQVQRLKAIAQDAESENVKLREALSLLLDNVDYTKGNCRINEQVGAVLPIEIIGIADRALLIRPPAIDGGLQ